MRYLSGSGSGQKASKHKPFRCDPRSHMTCGIVSVSAAKDHRKRESG